MRMQMFKVVDRPDHEWQLKNMHALTSSDFHQNIIYPIILSRIYCHFVAPKIKYVELAHVESAYAHDVSNVSIIRSATPKPIQQFIFVSKSKLNIYSSIIVEIRYPLCAAQRQQPHTDASNENSKYKQIDLYVLSRRIYTNIYLQLDAPLLVSRDDCKELPMRFTEQIYFVPKGTIFVFISWCFISSFRNFFSVCSQQPSHASRFISSCDLFMYSSFRSLYQSSRS